jgi:hypothetical protein
MARRATKGIGLSHRAYGALHGVSQYVISNHVKRGSIPTLPDGTIDPEAADTAWLANQTPSNESPLRRSIESKRGIRSDAPAEKPKVSFSEVRTQLEQIKVAKSAIDLQERKKQLVSAKEVEAAAYAQARAERDALLNWPARVSADMAATLGCNEALLYSLLEKHVREFLFERVEHPLMQFDKTA